MKTSTIVLAVVAVFFVIAALWGVNTFLQNSRNKFVEGQNSIAAP